MVDAVRFGAAVALVIAACSALGGAVASCSSEDPPSNGGAVDSGIEGSVTADVTTIDAGPDDATAPPQRDAAAFDFDGGPLPIVCASSPCATSLVTTGRTIFEDDSADRDGFCVLLNDRTVACWGANRRGQLGRGDDAGADSPNAARVIGLSDVVQLDHTCALDTSGAIWCWGTGPYLQNDAGMTTTERVPVKLPVPPATSVSVGAEVGCALAGGAVLCWGSNSSGQLAPFDVVPSSDSLPPREIAIPPGAPVRSVVVGTATLVLREDGTTVSWGTSPLLARVSSLNPDSYPDSVALNDISSIDLTGDVACATALGTGYCWGADRYGFNNVIPRPLPEPVVTPEPLVQIARPPVGRPRWCGVGATGAVYCWGENSGGQAGDGTKDHAFHAVQVKGLPAPAAQVRTTQNATCALLTNGKVYCWGTNYYGQLGNRMLKVPSLVPQEVVLP